jgi:hypothetical protein
MGERDMVGAEYSETMNGHPAFGATEKSDIIKVYSSPHWVKGVGDINYNRGGLYFDYYLNDELIVKRSFAGIYDVARELQHRGYHGTVMIVDKKSNMNHMHGDIDKLAKLTVVEDDEQGLRIIKWQPMPEELKAKFRAKREEDNGHSG